MATGSMPADIARIEMKIPDWVQQVLTAFESRSDPHNEVRIVDALDAVRKGQVNLDDEDRKGYIAERSAFLFIERPGEDSVWNTYFAPMMTATQNDGTELRTPDIKDLDADVVTHWQERAKAVQNPVMRARYADLVWDFGRAITKGRRQYEYAQVAIDSYLQATEKRMYSMDIKGVGWLRRALDLSLSIDDKDRQKRVVDSMFALYDRVVDSRHIAVWVFPFDVLYDKKDLLAPEQESRIIADLEAMLARTSDKGKPEEFDPWGAQAAAERLAQHYKRQNDKPNVERVIKAYGHAFEKMARDAGPMLAMAWLQPVIERYEQEGLKQEAEQLRIASAEKGKNIADDLRHFSVQTEIKGEDVERFVEHLIGSGDLKSSLLNIAIYFIPDANEARGLLEQMRANAPLMSRIPINLIDRGGRSAAKIGSLDEDAEGRLHRQIGQAIGFYQPFLAHTLEKLRERYAPTVEDILAALYESPLFLESRRELLREGLLAYEQGDFLKAIHVLVPQVEATLRNLMVLIGIPADKPVPRCPGISNMKSMNDALRDGRVQQVLTENLWRYLAVLYIDSKGGINLRNDLAHGLVGPNAFNRYTADRVFHSLLALSLLRSSGGRQDEGKNRSERTC